MKSHTRWGCPKRDDSTDRLREWDSDKGRGGGQKCDVIYGWSLTYLRPIQGAQLLAKFAFPLPFSRLQSPRPLLCLWLPSGFPSKPGIDGINSLRPLLVLAECLFQLKNYYIEGTLFAA